MTILDLNLLPLYRLKDQELPALPGLLAMAAPGKAARGRENDGLIVYLVLTGNATLTTAEYLQLTSQTASAFFQTPGSVTSAMGASAEMLNRTLLDRNLKSSGQGKYVVGGLVQAALRGTQCTLLQAGPSHIYQQNRDKLLHTYEPALSGKGLGVSQNAQFYLTQTDIQPGDRLLVSGNPSPKWEQALQDDQHPSIEGLRRNLFDLSTTNVNAVLIQAQEGRGALTVLRPTASSEGTLEEAAPAPEEPAHQPEAKNLPPLQQAESTPSAYAIPAQAVEETPPEIEEVVPEFPSSLPRAKPVRPDSDTSSKIDDVPPTPDKPRQPSEGTRQVARGLVSGMRATRRLGNAFGGSLQKILPNLLPTREDANQNTLSWNALMAFIAIAVPMIVVTAGFMMYSRFGRSLQYDANMLQAEEARTRALNATTPSRQRTEWQAALNFFLEAEKSRTTPELESFIQEAQSELDTLEGIQRMDFYPAFSGGVNAQISRLAANETDLYMLDAERGRVLHASQVGRVFEMDEAFRCEQGTYGDYQVGPIVDILILPRLNSLNAAVLGIDAGGTLLYCSPGRVGQAIPLAAPDSNWGRVTGFTLDSGNLYVLDASSRAIWVYTGQDASFIDRPYFFFGGQIPQIEDAIDLVVNADELFLLHADGHLSTCSYSRLDSVPTRCQDPITLINTIPAYQDIDFFEQVHITQMHLSSLPDATLMMLDSDNRSVLRISSRRLELQDQIYPMPGSALQGGPATAMTANPNRVLFLAVGDQIYFAAGMP